MRNFITGLFPGGVAAALENKLYLDKLKRGDTTVTQELITSDLLLAAVRESNVNERLQVASDDIVFEPSLETLKPFTKDAVEPHEGCKYGLYFLMVQFEKSLVYGKRVTVFYTLTDRNVGPKPKNYRWYSSENLENFDPSASDAEVASSLKEAISRVVSEVVAKHYPVR